MLEVIVPKSRERLLQQIQALEWQIKQDTNEKDKAIHIQALIRLQDELYK